MTMSMKEKSRSVTFHPKWMAAALAVTTCAAVGTTVHIINEDDRQRSAIEQERLKHERLLGDKLQLEKLMAGLQVELNGAQQDNTDARLRIAELERRIKQSEDRARGLEARSNGSSRTRKELAAAQQERTGLLNELEALRATERDLRAQLAQARNDHDALAARFEQQQMGAQMVNNAEVEALRGRKEKLTVVARRTREIRMAFDLPQHLAEQASFRIISPKGAQYKGADPALSWTFDKPGHEPMASIALIEGSTSSARAARVHLRFNPKEKLEPGVYRIDVHSGETYLNTVLLRLR
jgi:phage shock protein A